MLSLPKTNRIRFISSPNTGRSKKVSPKMHIRTKREAKKGKESELLTGCRHILHLLSHVGELCFRRIHVMPVQRSGFMCVNREMRGMEDLQIFLRGGRFWAVELKSLKGIQSDNQKSREEELRKIGHDYSVIRTIDDLLLGLSERGVNLNLVFKGAKPWLS